MTTLTLKIVNDETVLDSFPKEKPLTESQKELIRFIARTAIQEYIKEQKPEQHMGYQDRILRLPEVAKVVGVGSSSIWKYIKEGTFPKPLKLGIRSVGWKESQVLAWLDERVPS